MHTNKILWVVREYLKTFSQNLENVKEMGKFLDTRGLPKLNQETLNNINRSIMSNEMEDAIVS